MDLHVNGVSGNQEQTKGAVRRTTTNPSILPRITRPGKARALLSIPHPMEAGKPIVPQVTGWAPPAPLLGLTPAPDFVHNRD